MTNPEQKFIYALDDIVLYQGYYNDIKEWIIEGDKEFAKLGKKYPSNLRPPVKCKYHPKPDNINEGLQLLWMMCVLMYGDYGTSPRYGWINRWDECRQFLLDITETERRYNAGDLKCVGNGNGLEENG